MVYASGIAMHSETKQWSDLEILFYLLHSSKERWNNWYSWSSRSWYLYYYSSLKISKEHFLTFQTSLKKTPDHMTLLNVSAVFSPRRQVWRISCVLYKALIHTCVLKQIVKILCVPQWNAKAGLTNYSVPFQKYVCVFSTLIYYECFKHRIREKGWMDP